MRFGILFLSLLLLLAPGEEQDGQVRPMRTAWTLVGAPAEPMRPEAARRAAPALPPLPPPEFIWPAQGPITNVAQPSHPLGVDIGLAAAPNTPVKASADGKVVFAGGDPCCSYGIYVVVEHSPQLRSKYAHLSRASTSRWGRR